MEPANCKKYGIALYGASWISDDNYLLGTGSDLPYRMAVHPGGDGVICSLPKSCRCFEWDTVKSTDGKKLGLKPSDKVIDELEDVGQQLALIFNNDEAKRHLVQITMSSGDLVFGAIQDGKLRVFKWPSMEIILDVSNAHASLKDLDFSPDGKFLVSVGSGGPGRVWDVTSSKPVASLSKEHDEVFGFCRFSRSEKNPVLYITAMRGQGGSIVKWDTSSWKRVSTKHVVRDPVCAFNASVDGMLLAVGTIQGDVLIITSANMHAQNVVRKAHLGLVTALMFSQDSRALVSVSLDSSARVTMIKDAKRNEAIAVIIVVGDEDGGSRIRLLRSRQREDMGSEERVVLPLKEVREGSSRSRVSMCSWDA
ncbi:hypothetical protein RHSIM_Rhsim03G0185500 [Rhododendron simsii]|uniref:Anaphase-promoting complex subunit 4 WD40 domain-containing protein n=1 Tax=Rhododendron simsii TaxID=118357 RepID=A0A834H7A0_RHOSS|nr:hypothetical protein RHSIM_Rhsim03G0185500 [Rhododendron simsii]